MLNLSVIIPTRNANPDYLLMAFVNAWEIGAEVCCWFDEDEAESDNLWRIKNSNFLPEKFRYGIGRVGKIGAMNKALEMTTRDYVFYCGDDDAIGYGAMPLVHYLESNPSMAFAYGSQKYMGERSDLVIGRQYDKNDFYYANLPLNAIVYRRDVVLSLGGYRDILGDPMRGDQPEDYDLLLRVIEAGHEGVYVPTSDPVHYYTLSNNRMWALMQQNADEVYQAFKAHHPKYTGGRL